jgi:dephospho-CoA kinase
LQQLNNIVHPAVQRDTVAWQTQHESVPYTLKEAALLIESNSHRFLDKIIVVTAPVALRIERAMQRDNTSREAILARLEKQLTDEQRLAHADFVIENDGTKSLVEQVWTIHQKIVLNN